MAEKYRPSEKDMKEATDSMSEAQDTASERRERMVQEVGLESLKRMRLDYQDDTEKNETHLSGQLTGKDGVQHDVLITERRTKTTINPKDFAQEARRSEKTLSSRDGGVYELSYEGIIDGKPITHKNAKLLWEQHQFDALRIRVVKNSVQQERNYEQAQKDREAEEELMESLLG